MWMNFKRWLWTRFYPVLRNKPVRDCGDLMYQLMLRGAQISSYNIEKEAGPWLYKYAYGRRLHPKAVGMQQAGIPVYITARSKVVNGETKVYFWYSMPVRGLDVHY